MSKKIATALDLSSNRIHNLGIGSEASDAVNKSQLDLKVTANDTITSGTNTKITYDSKGLVTSGTNLSASDIPNININQVNTLQTVLDSKLDNISLIGEYTQLKPVFSSGQTSKLTASAANNSAAQGWTKLYSWSPAAYGKRHLMLHATSGDRGTLTGVVSVSFMQEANATTISAANITSEHIAGTVSNFSLIYNTDTSMIELWYNDIFSSNRQTVFSPIKISGTTPTAYYGVSQASLPAYSTKFNSIDLHVDYLEGLTGNVQTQINDCFNDDPFYIQPTTDLNSIVNSGSYRIYSSVAFSATYNQPVGAYTYGQLRVFVGRVGQVYQEYHPDIAVNTNARTVYRRNKYATSNAWSGWVRDVTTDDLDAKSPLDTTLIDNAASSTLPTTTSGSLVSKIQQIRDYLKYLLNSVNSISGDYVSKTTTNAQSISSELVTKKSIYNHRTAGTSGVAGHFKICTITISNDYTNRPLEFTITQRSKLDSAKVSLLFNNDSGLNPGIAAFTYNSLSTYGIYAYRSATSVWEIYVSKTENYDNLEVSEFHDAQGQFPNIVWETSQVSAVPSGSIQATLATLINDTSGNAETATKLETARNIALTGDVSGSANFDGSANIIISAKVEDDSHNHVIGNVDGLQDALNSKVSITQNSWNATYLGDTYRYVKIASITTSDNDYTTHCLFVGKSFYWGYHFMQGVLYIAQSGFGSGSFPSLTFIGQARNCKLVYIFDDTANLLEIYLHCSSGGGKGLVNGFTTNIITSTDPSRITLYTSGNPVTSVTGAVNVYRIYANPVDSQTTLDGDVFVAGNVQADYTAEMSAWSGNPYYARFGHKDFNAASGFGFMQTNDGRAFIETPASQPITLRQNGASKFWVDENGYSHVIAPPSANSSDVVPTTAWVRSIDDTKLNRDGTNTMTGNIIFDAVTGTGLRQIRMQMATNDYARIAAGGTADDAGWMEIATAVGGNEPIYVRQYSGTFGTIVRTATLLDNSGNTSFPGNVTIVAPATSDDSAKAVSSAWVKDVAAPISHASSSETYGKSTASNYGHSKASSSTPVMDGTAAVGTDDGTYARGDHKHPSDTSRLAIGSGLSSGTQIIKRAWSSSNTYANGYIYLEY